MIKMLLCIVKLFYKDNEKRPPGQVKQGLKPDKTTTKWIFCGYFCKALQKGKKWFAWLF